jgi:hypothetical protein
MPQYLFSEPSDAILGALGDALDLVGVGILLLDRDLRVRFANRRRIEIFDNPPALFSTGPIYRSLLDRAADKSLLAVPASALAEFLDQREAAVRAGTVPPTQINLADGRRVQISCVACPDGGRIPSYIENMENCGARQATPWK